MMRSDARAVTLRNGWWSWWPGSGVALLAALLVACGPADPPATPASPPAGQAPAVPAPTAADGPALPLAAPVAGITLPATFAGVLPCADCEGIDTTLTLDADFRFRLRSRYLGKPAGDNVVVDAGRFAASDAATRLALYGAGDTVVIFAVQGPEQLTRLDTTGQPITSQLNYTLKRAPAVDAIADPAPAVGVFTYLADAPLFVDCHTEQRLPVAMRADYVALEKAYAAAGGGGLPRIAELRGHVEQLVGAEESQGPRPTLVVDRFEKLTGEASCRRPRAPLQGTRWLLTQLGDAPLPADATARPDLVLDPAGERLGGSTGCNAMSGGYDYSVGSGALTVGSIATTRKACPPGPVEEVTYTLALQRATQASITGETLVLADDQGPLATFVAEYPAAAR